MKSLLNSIFHSLIWMQFIVFLMAQFVNAFFVHYTTSKCLVLCYFLLQYSPRILNTARQCGIMLGCFEQKKIAILYDGDIENNTPQPLGAYCENFSSLWNICNHFYRISLPTEKKKLSYQMFPSSFFFFKYFSFFFQLFFFCFHSSLFYFSFNFCSCFHFVSETFCLLNVLWCICVSVRANKNKCWIEIVVTWNIVVEFLGKSVRWALLLDRCTTAVPWNSDGARPWLCWYSFRLCYHAHQHCCRCHSCHKFRVRAFLWWDATWFETIHCKLI